MFQRRQILRTTLKLNSEQKLPDCSWCATDAILKVEAHKLYKNLFSPSSYTMETSFEITSIPSIKDD
jgi:hypothetical protein